MKPAVSSVAGGVRRITLPLELSSPDHLHCYLLDLEGGPLLVDTGMASTARPLRKLLAEIGAPLPRVLITHGHVDHWGAAAALTDSVLAHPGVRPSIDYAGGRGGPDPDQWPPGLPGPEEMERAFGRFRSLISGVPAIEPLRDREHLGSWQVIWTPGHDQGHVCLYRAGDRTLIGGDLLLPGFTPNIQPPIDGDGDSVQDFFDSLRLVESIDVDLVLPAHGEPYTDAGGRARELIEHHEQRLGELRAALGRGGSAGSALRGLTDLLFERLEGSEDRMLGDLETIAHLEHLRARGEAERDERGRWYAADAAVGRD